MVGSRRKSQIKSTRIQFRKIRMLGLISMLFIVLYNTVIVHFTIVEKELFGFFGEMTSSEIENPTAIDKPEDIEEKAEKVEFPCTIVTAYFSVRSKHPSGNYDGWMKNILSLKDPMVIFTSPDRVESMKEIRMSGNNDRSAPLKTVVVPINLTDVPMAMYRNLEYWQAELDRDPEKRIHRSYEVFWIWLSKTHFVKTAIEMNPFSTPLYMWYDIGSFRNSNYNNKTLIQHPEIVPRDAVLHLAHHTIVPPPPPFWWNNKLKEKVHFYHSGSSMIGYADVLLEFHDRFLTTFEGFVERHMFVGEDQTILECTCLQHPHICEYIPCREVRDNFYFGLRYALHHGGTYKRWRPSSLLNNQTSQS